MPIRKLDYRNVLTLPAAEVTTKNPRGRQRYTDSIQPGFTLHVHASGARMYYVVYRFGNKVRNYKIGPPDRAGEGLPIADARKKAREILGRVAAGEDPAAQRRMKRLEHRLGADSLAALGDRLIKAADIAETTRYMWLWVWAKHIAPRGAAGQVLGHAAKPPALVARRDVRELLERIPSKPVARNARKVLSWVFARAVEEEIVGASPCIALGRRKERPRDRVLTHRELRGVWNAAGTCGRYGAAVRFIILTAARRREAFNATWSEIDADAKVWRIPAERFKSRHTHVVPLTTMARDLLAGLQRSPSDERLFRTTAGDWHWRRLLAKAGIPDVDVEAPAEDVPAAKRPRAWKAHPFRMHDLRRTVRNTLTHELGVNGAVAEAVIGHKAPKIIETYAPAGVGLGDVARALELWADHLRAIVEAKPVTSAASAGSGSPASGA